VPKLTSLAVASKRIAISLQPGTGGFVAAVVARGDSRVNEEAMKKVLKNHK
jgi:hypothetical protein